MLYFWLAIVVILTIIEASTVNLITIWFIASGLLTMIVCLFTDNILIQLSVFVIVGIILLLTTKKYLINLLKINREKTNADRVVGMEAEVTENITKTKPGEVYVDGKRWTAISDKSIKKGEIVKVLAGEGVKLKVEEVK